MRGLKDAVGLEVGGDGTIYVAESATNRVLRFAGRARRRTVVVSTGLDQPIGLALLRDGALTPVLEDLTLPAGLRPAPGGGVFVIDHVRHDAFGKILLLRPDGTTSTLSEGKIRALTGIAVSRAGVPYATAFSRPFIGRLDAAGALRPLGTRRG